MLNKNYYQPTKIKRKIIKPGYSTLVSLNYFPFNIKVISLTKNNLIKLIPFPKELMIVILHSKIRKPPIHSMIKKKV